MNQISNMSREYENLKNASLWIINTMKAFMPHATSLHVNEVGLGGLLARFDLFQAP